MAAPTVSPTPKMNRSQSGEISDDNLNDSSITQKDSSVKTNPFLGFFYLVLCVMCAGFISVIVKKIAYINPCQLALIRNVGVFVGALPIFIYVFSEDSINKEDTFLILLRGFFSATGNYMYTIAFRYLPLSVAGVVMSSYPVVTAVLARLYLKEACGFVLMFNLILTILGVLLSVRLPDVLRNINDIQINSNYLGGLAAAIAGVLLLSLSQVTLRKLKHVHFSISVLCVGFIGIIENTVINAVAFSFVPSNCGWDEIMYVLLGIIGFMHVAWNTLANPQQPAGIAAVEIASLHIIIFPMFQFFFFYEYPDIYVICGACLVMISLGVIGLQNWLIMMPEESTVRKKLKYMMY